MAFRTSKRASNGGKMIAISAYKLAIFKGRAPVGMSAQKRQKIERQVAKMLAQIEIVKRYTPFTTKSARRRPRQVGA